MAKKCPFFPPCGAKSWGSGGAPPTNLILLRNQFGESLDARAHASHAPALSRRPHPAPRRPSAPPTQSPARGRWWLVVVVGVGVGW